MNHGIAVHHQHAGELSPETKNQLIGWVVTSAIAVVGLGLFIAWMIMNTPPITGG